MNMNDVELCCLLAWRLHHTEVAVRATLHRLRPRVRREIQPLVGQLARHKEIQKWLTLIAAN